MVGVEFESVLFLLTLTETEIAQSLKNKPQLTETKTETGKCWITETVIETV